VTPSGHPARLAGSVNVRGQALVEVQVSGPGGLETVTCAVDTGFTGELVLPAALVGRLGLRRAGTNVARLADDSPVRLSRHVGEVVSLAGRRRVRVYAAGSGTSLLGARLLTPHRLIIDYRARTVEIV
jgi:predicted aspartyl protease